MNTKQRGLESPSREASIFISTLHSWRGSAIHLRQEQWFTNEWHEQSTRYRKVVFWFAGEAHCFIKNEKNHDADKCSQQFFLWRISDDGIRSPHSAAKITARLWLLSAEKFKHHVGHWQGTKQLSKFKNLDLLKIYLITDNKKELKKRLIKRNQNTREEIKKRFKSFDDDVKHWSDYDYIIINKNLEACFRQIEIIISLEKNIFTSFPHKFS